MDSTKLTQLIVKSQSGDQYALEELLRYAHTSVSYQCRKLLKNQQDAEDTTQEVLLTVYTKLDTLQNPATFTAWLNRITANRCMNALTRGHKELQFAEDEEGHSVLDNLEELDEQQIPDKALDNAETARMIEELVDALPDAQRMCTLLYYYDEMNVSQIANVMRTSENTVKSRLNYARKSIKEGVLDYEKQGIKLYSLSPLPFLLYFLRQAAARSADPVAAQAAVKSVVGASGAAAAGTAASSAAATAAGGAGTGSAAGSTILGALSVKVVAGIVAGAMALGGIALGVASLVNPSQDAPVTGATIGSVGQNAPADVSTPPAETAAQPTQSQESALDTLLNDYLDEAFVSKLPYTGDINQIKLTVEQAEAFAAIIEESISHSQATAAETIYPPFCRVALFDSGNGVPALWVVEGTHIYEDNSDYMPSSSKVYQWDGRNAVLTLDTDGWNCFLTNQGLVLDNFSPEWFMGEYSYSLLYPLNGEDISGQQSQVFEYFGFEQMQRPDTAALESHTAAYGRATTYDLSSLTDALWYFDNGYMGVWQIAAFDGTFISIQESIANGAAPMYAAQEWLLGHGHGGSRGADHEWKGIWGDAAATANLLRGEEVSDSPYVISVSIDPESGKQRTTMDPQGKDLVVYFEFPLLEESTAGSRKFNEFFQSMNDEFFRDEDGSIAALLEFAAAPTGVTPYYHTRSVTVRTQSEKLVSASVSGFWYAGARQYTFADYYTFDAQSGRQLTLTDLVDGTEEELRAMILSTLQSYYGDALWGYGSTDGITMDDFIFYIENGQVYIFMTSRFNIMLGMSAVPLEAELKAEWK